MGEVINLRLARKARKRSADAAAADANRAKFGRDKAERLVDATEAARRAKLLDHARLNEEAGSDET